MPQIWQAVDTPCKVVDCLLVEKWIRTKQKTRCIERARLFSGVSTGVS